MKNKMTKKSNKLTMVLFAIALLTTSLSTVFTSNTAHAEERDLVDNVSVEIIRSDNESSTYVKIVPYVSKSTENVYLKLMYYTSNNGIESYKEMIVNWDDFYISDGGLNASLNVRYEKDIDQSIDKHAVFNTNQPELVMELIDTGIVYSVCLVVPSGSVEVLDTVYIK